MSQDAPQMKLDVTMRTARVSAGDEVDAVVKLSNVSARVLWVNRRFLVNSTNAPRPFREVWVDIQGPGRKRLDFERKIRAGAAGAQHYGVLAPNEVLEMTLKLSRNFDLTMPGAYAFVVNYQDGNSAPPPPPSGVEHFSQRVRSPVVEFKVVGQQTH